MVSFFGSLFIWWKRHTFGTHIFTFMNGDYIGSDGWGNKYYQSKRGERRWVLYSAECDASLIPPKWHGWLHKVVNESPTSADDPEYILEAMYKNETGSHNSYHPNKMYAPIEEGYAAWEPEN